jgi:hypothetical protein
MYYIFVENGKINGSGECECLTEGFENIEVTEEIYNNFIEDADRYIYQDGEIIPNPDYEEIKANERKAEFESKFIQTIWGWYRKQPKGYANAPQSIDIIFNIVNASGSFTEQVANMMLFYQQPDYDNAEECTEEWLVAHQYKHEPCSIQEFMQFYIAFQTAWANDQYKSEPPAST